MTHYSRYTSAFSTIIYPCKSNKPHIPVEYFFYHITLMSANIKKVEEMSYKKNLFSLEKKVYKAKVIISTVKSWQKVKKKYHFNFMQFFPPFQCNLQVYVFMLLHVVYSCMCQPIQPTHSPKQFTISCQSIFIILIKKKLENVKTTKKHPALIKKNNIIFSGLEKKY